MFVILVLLFYFLLSIRSRTKVRCIIKIIIIGGISVNNIVIIIEFYFVVFSFVAIIFLIFVTVVSRFISVIINNGYKY